MSTSNRPYHHGRLRESLLDAGFELLRDTPVSELSLRAVAKQAEVSHAAPYHHFANRTALLEALGTECMERFVGRQRTAVENADSGRRSLRDLGVAYVGFAAEEPHAFELIFDPVICPPDNPSPEKAELIDENWDLLSLTVQRAQDEGLFTGEEVEVLANGLWGTVHGLAHLVTEGHMSLESAATAIAAIAGSES